MDTFDKKLFEYADRFGENFPTFYYRDLTQAQVIELIDKCLTSGKPVETESDTDKDV